MIYVKYCQEIKSSCPKQGEQRTMHNIECFISMFNYHSYFTILLLDLKMPSSVTYKKANSRVTITINNCLMPDVQ